MTDLEPCIHHIYEFPTGHVGMAVSGKAHAELWPRVATWFRERSVTQSEESATVDQGEAEAETDQDRSLQTLDRIGPTYEERLHDAGITTVTQLAATEPVSLADRLCLNESRVTSWIEQARQFTGSSDDNAGSS